MQNYLWLQHLFVTWIYLIGDALERTSSFLF